MKITFESMCEVVKEVLDEAEIVKEGRGLAARKEGDTFTNDTGEKIIFNSIQLFPEDGAYEEIEQLVQDLNDFVSKNDIKVKEVNKPNLSAMLAIFDVNGQKIGFVRYFPLMSRKGFYKWGNNVFTKDTGFSMKKGQAFLEKLPLQPSELVGDERERNIYELGNTVIANAERLVNENKLPEQTLEHLKILFKSAAGNKSSPILKGAAQYAAAYDKYLGEIFAPVSLLTGWLSTGDREKSEKVLLQGEKYSNCLISFGMSKTEKLVDSKMILDDKQIGVSSKAGSGAAATVTTFKDILNKMEEENPKELNIIRKKFPSLVKIISIISEQNWFEGPLKIAETMGLMTSQESTMVRNAKEISDLRKFQKFVKFTKNVINLSKMHKGISPFELKDAPAGYVPIYHVISGIAKTVVQKINSTNEFEQFVRHLLNHSSMVQINSNIRKLGEDAQFAQFKVKYPPAFNGKIIADAGKNYSSSRIRGKISFKIK